MLKKIIKALVLMAGTMLMSMTVMAGNCEIENNDSFSRATPMALNSVMTGIYTKYDTRTDEDWFTFTLTEYGVSYFRFGPSEDGDWDLINYGWDVYLMDEDQNTISSWWVESPVYKRYVLGPGRYYIRVCPRATNIAPWCEYQMSVEFTKDDGWDVDWPNEVKKIDANRVYMGFLYYGGDADSFFCPNVGSPATFHFKIDENLDQRTIHDGWDIDIYDGDRNLLLTKRSVTSNLSIADINCKNGIRIQIEARWSNSAPVDCTYSVQVIGKCRASAASSNTKVKKASGTVKKTSVNTTLPGQAVLTKAKGGKRKITLTWKRAAGADGYIIYRSARKSGGYKVVKTIGSGNSVKWTNKKLARGRRYYYKIKAYKVVNGKKNLSKSYSAVRSAKVK